MPRAERRTVAADLTEPLPEPLLAAGFDPGVPVAWLAEGVLVYLESRTVHRLLGEITALSCPGSRFAAESGARRPGPADLGGVEALWLSGGPDGPDVVLPPLGWSIEVESLGDAAAGYGRPAGGSTVSSFVTAERR